MFAFHERRDFGANALLVVPAFSSIEVEKGHPSLFSTAETLSLWTYFFKHPTDVFVTHFSHRPPTILIKTLSLITLAGR